MKNSITFQTNTRLTLILACTICLSAPMTVWADTPGSVGESAPTDQGQQEHLYNLAASKLVARGKMTSDDFRNLQMGMTGFDIVRRPGDKYPKVDEVFPGCPAELAGVKVGDLLVEGDPIKDYNINDSALPLWAYTGGQAGSVINIKVLRKGEIIPISITRMNIEDVPDPKLRKLYENMAKKYAESGKAFVAADKPSRSILDAGK